MIVMLELLFLLALAHFIYEFILAPSWRLSLRCKLSALRDELHALKVDCGDRFDDPHYTYLRDSIDTMILMLHCYDVVTIVAAEFRYRRDREFRRRVDARARILDDCNIPQAQNVRRRSVYLIAWAIAVNSAMLCAPLYPLALLGIGLSAIQRRLRKFSALSRRELESMAPDAFRAASG